jgi:hypothetical protein
MVFFFKILINQWPEKSFIAFVPADDKKIVGYPALSVQVWDRYIAQT